MTSNVSNNVSNNVPNIKKIAQTFVDQMSTNELLDFVNNNWMGECLLMKVPKEIVFYIFRYLHTKDILNVCVSHSMFRRLKTVNPSWKSLLMFRLANPNYKLKYSIEHFENVHNAHSINGLVANSLSSWFAMYMFWAFLVDSKVDQRLRIDRQYGIFLHKAWGQNPRATKKHCPILLSKKLSNLCGFPKQVWIPKYKLRVHLRKFVICNQPYHIRLTPQMREMTNITNHRTRTIPFREFLIRLRHNKQYASHWWQVV